MPVKTKDSDRGSETIVIGGEEDYDNVIEDLMPDEYDPFSGPSHRLDEDENEPDEIISEITLEDEDEDETGSKETPTGEKEDTSASDALSGLIEAGFGALFEDPVKTIKGIANIKLPFMDMTVGEYFKSAMFDLADDLFHRTPQGYQYGDDKEWHPFTKEMNFIEDIRKKGAFDDMPFGYSDVIQEKLMEIQEDPKYAKYDRQKLAQDYIEKIVLQLNEPKVPNSDIKVVEDQKVVDVPLPVPQPGPGPQPEPKPRPEPEPGDKRKDRIDLKDYENKRIKHINRLKKMPKRQSMDVFTRMTGFEPVHNVPDQSFNIFYGSGNVDPWFQ